MSHGYEKMKEIGGNWNTAYRSNTADFIILLSIQEDENWIFFIEFNRNDIRKIMRFESLR